MDRIDHTRWDRLLKAFVDGDGNVNYKAWHGNRAAVQDLDQYLRTLSTAGRRQAASRDGQLAYWINAYNAVTVRGILREYPTTSIRNHTPRLFGYNIWKNLLLHVGGGKPISLDAIEHQVLRPLKDPRIHFAIVCASRGCPVLRREAYQPKSVQQQLEAAANDFFRRPQNFRHDPATRRFYLSAILSWFGKDFGAGQAAVLTKIAKWLPTSAARKAATSNSVTVSYLSYDWGLNEPKK